MPMRPKEQFPSGGRACSAMIHRRTGQRVCGGRYVPGNNLHSRISRRDGGAGTGTEERKDRKGDVAIVSSNIRGGGGKYIFDGDCPAAL
mmetsp:Transcript_751/g.1706  ORF Transcript_751/g.1706 Transcript_751/m.1706 type:complete len:89 (-) Transcript_751:639-905(-)